MSPKVWTISRPELAIFYSCCQCTYMPSVNILFYDMILQQCVLQLPSALQSDFKIGPNFYSYISPFFDHLFWLKKIALYRNLINLEKNKTKRLKCSWSLKNPLFILLLNFQFHSYIHLFFNHLFWLKNSFL